MNLVRALLGIALLLGIAVALSENRRRIRPRLVFSGLALQWLFAILILRTAPGRALFDWAREGVTAVLGFTDVGASFLFGNLYRGDPGVLGHIPPGPGPIRVMDGASGEMIDLGFSVAIHVLPTIVFFSALMSVLYHLGVMQLLVRGAGWVMARTMGTSGAESLSAAANIFVGQTEAPLVVRPYVSDMTRSELMAIMTGGFATVAGGVLAAYIKFGIDAGHLLAASVMSAPAALVIAKIILPETATSAKAGARVDAGEKTTANVIDAAASGAGDGLKLALNVGAMLMAFVSLVAVVDAGLGWIGGFIGAEGLTLSRILGWGFAPVAWAIGVDSADILPVGELLGTKVAVNEFLAYLDLAAAAESLSDRSYTITTYALCGFANFSSIAIQIGGIGSIAPDRRQDLARLGVKAMLGGALASFMTAAIAGALI